MFEMHRTDKAWADACAEADRLDPGWRWQDLLATRPVAPDDRGVGTRVLEITAALPFRWPDWATLLRDEDVPPPPQRPPAAPTDEPPLPPGFGDELAPSAEEWRKQCGHAAEDSLSETGSNQPLSAKDTTVLRIGLASAAAAQKRADGLETHSPNRLKRTHAATHLADALPAHVSDTRTVVKLLRMRAQLLAQEGQPDAALAETRGECLPSHGSRGRNRHSSVIFSRLRSGPSRSAPSSAFSAEASRHLRPWRNRYRTSGKTWRNLPSWTRSAASEPTSRIPCRPWQMVALVTMIST